MSDSLQTKKPGEEKTEAGVQFRSDNIGRWASQQENPFAEQNRRTLAKYQKRDEKRQKHAPFVIITASLVAVTLSVIGLIFLVIGLSDKLPEDVTLGSDGAAEIQDQAQAVYDRYMNSDKGNSDERNEDAINAVTDFFNNKSNLTTDEATKADIALIEMTFYNNNGQLQTVLDMADRVNVDVLSEISKSQYYGMLMNAAYNIGNTELGDWYSERLDSLDLEDEAVEG